MEFIFSSSLYTTSSVASGGIGRFIEKAREASSKAWDQTFLKEKYCLLKIANFLRSKQVTKQIIFCIGLFSCRIQMLCPLDSLCFKGLSSTISGNVWHKWPALKKKKINVAEAFGPFPPIYVFTLIILSFSAPLIVSPPWLKLIAN